MAGLAGRLGVDYLGMDLAELPVSTSDTGRSEDVVRDVNESLRRLFTRPTSTTGLTGGMTQALALAKHRM
jgi:hypothetical protein